MTFTASNATTVVSNERLQQALEVSIAECLGMATANVSVQVSRASTALMVGYELIDPPASLTTAEVGRLLTQQIEPTVNAQLRDTGLVLGDVTVTAPSVVFREGATTAAPAPEHDDATTLVLHDEAEGSLLWAYSLAAVASLLLVLLLLRCALRRRRARKEEEAARALEQRGQSVTREEHAEPVELGPVPAPGAPVLAVEDEAGSARDGCESQDGSLRSAASECLSQFAVPDSKTLACWMRTVYARYNPSKLAQVDSLLAKYEGREDELIEHIVTKYRLGPCAPKHTEWMMCGGD